jgi:hypothetical protein
MSRKKGERMRIGGERRERMRTKKEKRMREKMKSFILGRGNEKRIKKIKNKHTSKYFSELLHIKVHE